MKRLFSYIKDNNGIELDTIKESFNTTLYSFFEDEEQKDDQVKEQPSDKQADNKKDQNDNSSEDKEDKSKEEEPKKDQSYIKNAHSSEFVTKIKEVLFDLKAKIIDIANNIDRLVRSNMKFPENWKIKAIKDDSGNVFVGVRETYESKRPYNKTVKVTFTRMAILQLEANNIFVYNADNMEQWSAERTLVINDLLSLLNALKSHNGSLYEYNIGDNTTSPEEPLNAQNNKDKADAHISKDMDETPDNDGSKAFDDNLHKEVPNTTQPQTKDDNTIDIWKA